MCFVLVHEYLQYNHSGNYIATPHTCLIMTVESRTYSVIYMNWNSICTNLSSSQISKSLFKEERIYYNSLRIWETEGSFLKYGYFYCDIITHTHTPLKWTQSAWLLHAKICELLVESTSSLLFDKSLLPVLTCPPLSLCCWLSSSFYAT